MNASISSSDNGKVSEVVVRMYTHGLGDCFLLTFPTNVAEQPYYYVLIDCGVILGTEGAEGKMQRVAEDIQKVTGGEIHLLVITHQHWDHLSGFAQAKDIFENMNIHNLWLAWTEDPTDSLANQLSQEFKKDLRALHLALQRASQLEKDVAELKKDVADRKLKLSSVPTMNVIDQLKPVEYLAGFFGDPERVMAGARADVGLAFKSDTETALETVRELVKKNGSEPQYLCPGDGPRDFPSSNKELTTAAQVYVLGPPHNEAQLKKINPTAEGKEVYTGTKALTPRRAFLAALLDDEDDKAAWSVDEREILPLSFPFDRRLRIPCEEAKNDAPFAADFSQYDAFMQYYDNATAWRRIDGEWLATTEALALQMDSYTNNTSLVLAIELKQSHKVLMFVADAQVGNWLSWDDLSWSPKNTPGVTVTAADLLSRTVLYKVGHHGSHNATIRARGDDKKGLELMTHPELAAMVPVDEEVAHDIKHWLSMPFPPLLDRLNTKTRGRVIRADTPVPKSAPPGADVNKWTDFRGRIKEDNEVALNVDTFAEFLPREGGVPKNVPQDFKGSADDWNKFRDSVKKRLYVQYTVRDE
ncbi:MAG: hypothetical protein H0X37_25550 [Herpetosiphonaceae bacterium]|nr:hypothetical protein [Herpetosiphonaceae bacterium]